MNFYLIIVCSLFPFDVDCRDFVQPEFPTPISGKEPDNGLVDIERPRDLFRPTKTSTDGVEIQSVPGASHLYSKRQAWNADETHLVTSQNELINVFGKKIIETLPFDGDFVWSNKNSELLFGFKLKAGKLNQFVRYNISTKTTTEIKTFDGWDAMSIGGWEGNSSNSDRYFVFAGTFENGRHLISYDIVQNEPLGTIRAKWNFNWAGFSQSGKHILVENNHYPDPNPVLIQYKPDLTGERQIYKSPNHGDFCIDMNGDDVYMMAGKKLEWIHLDSGSVSSFSFNEYNYGHISCRSINRPGWAYISFTNPGVIGAVPIDTQSQKWEFWGYHRSSQRNYAAQAKASASPSGTKVIFTSDWFGGQEISDFVLSVPVKVMR